jgi:hypothetical protein
MGGRNSPIRITLLRPETATQRRIPFRCRIDAYSSDRLYS